MDKNFIAVVLGGDVNSYAIARAFYEEYKIKTIVVGQFPLYPTTHTRLIKGYYYKDLLDNKGLIKALTDINNLYPDKKKILFGNVDYYVKHILENRKEINNISSSYIIPIIELDLFNKLVNKRSFYELCDKYGLEHPETVVFDFSKDNIDKFNIPFEYPVFAKPSDSVAYSKVEFNGKQKGYKIKNHDEFVKVMKTIKESGFNDLFLIQEYIKGDDDSMYVFTCYANQKHEVKAITGGQILMHDRSPKLIGNYNAIKNIYNEEISLKLKNFLEKINFVGICHFDVQYDSKKNRYVVYEINIRTGRSNYYTLASHTNMAKLVVEDYIYNKDSEFFIANIPFIASIVPKWALKKSIRKNKQTIKLKNFSRYSLVWYDINPLRLYYQYRWDRKIIKEYFKYN